MAVQRIAEFARGRIPQANDPVSNTAGQGLAFGTEGDAVGPVRLVVQRVVEFTRGCIPQVKGSPVTVAGDQGLAVGTEGYAVE